MIYIYEIVGEPVRKLAAVNVPNKHLEYVVTWYSLTGFLLLAMKRGRVF